MAFSIQSFGGAGGGGTAIPGQLDPQAQEAQRKIQQLTEGRAGELKKDPYQTAALDFMKGTVSGANVPFTNTVKNSMMAQHGAGSAAAESAQMEALRQGLGASGGSIYDPGYQAAQREAMSQRQGSNLDAQGQINMKADTENFQAQAAGANSMAAARAAQNAQINQMNLAGADMRARTAIAVPSQPAAPAPAAATSGYNYSGLKIGPHGDISW